MQDQVMKVIRQEMMTTGIMMATIASVSGIADVVNEQMMEPIYERLMPSKN
jgi:hypothetical protein